MINYIQGSLFDTQNDIIAHGVNCQGVMGSGVAYGIRQSYPKAYTEYLEKFDQDGWKLGQVQFVQTVSGKTIANCATQYDYLPRNQCHADYAAIALAMTRVKEYAKNAGLSIAIPKIGAGLAGGDWEKVEAILKDVFTDYDITIYYL